MKRAAIVLLSITLSLVILLPIVARRIFGTPIHYGYRLHVQLNSPAGVLTGSSLYVLNATRGRPYVTGGGPYMWGEAIVLTGNNGKKIVVAVPDNEFPRKVFDVKINYEEIENGHSISSKLANIPEGSKLILHARDLPPIFTFDDINDPNSVKVLRYSRGPAQIDRFDEVMGQGWGFLGAQIEMISVPSWRYIFFGTGWIPDWISSRHSQGESPRNVFKWLTSTPALDSFDRAWAQQTEPGISLRVGRFYRHGW